MSAEPVDPIEAIRAAVAESMPDPVDIVEATREAVSCAMPEAALILDALCPLDPPWTPLPPGSHLRLDDDERGVDVVALRSREIGRWDAAKSTFDRRERGEVMTERGDLVDLDAGCRLQVGRGR